MRVCQFRHDGKWTSAAAAGRLPHQEDLQIYFTVTLPGVKHRGAGSPSAAKAGADLVGVAARLKAAPFQS